MRSRLTKPRRRELVLGTVWAFSTLVVVTTAGGSPPVPGLQPMRPRYSFPIRPATAASFSRGGHPYPAVDIFAPSGSAFMATTAGVIEDVQRDETAGPPWTDERKGGRWVSILGDDGFRYYGSHLLRVEDGLQIGQRVSAGDRLGQVGSSGNARGKPPHLHFGVSRVNEPYSWRSRRGTIDPVAFLKCLGDGGTACSSKLRH
jgi:murein DD-endopeptidase MepM/ murein hydrolase activator NlpD